MKRRRKPQQAGAHNLFDGAVESGPDRDTTSSDPTSPIREDQPSFDLAEDPSPMTASQHHDNNDSAVMDSSAEQATDDTLKTNPHDEEGRELFSMPAGAHPDDDTLGSRLRAAREARGLSIDEVGTRLRLPQRVIASLESGDLATIEHDVYLRGYLASYTRLLDLPLDTLRNNLDRERRPTQPPLVATGRISHSRYLFQRYSVPAVYVVLTGLIVAPAIWLASHGGLERNLARVTTLDADGAPGSTTTPLELASSSNTTATGTPSQPATSEPVAVPQQRNDAPLMASMALPNIKHEQAPEPVAVPPPAAAPSSGKYQVSLRLKEASWVEIVGADGRKLEFGLLPAGAERSYGTDQAVSVRLGNANGAEVDVNGKPVDLQPFRRANVAHVKLVDGNAVAPGASPSAN